MTDFHPRPDYTWLKNRLCPNCGDLLFSDWHWDHDYDMDVVPVNWQDYCTWWLVCEECQENFNDVDGRLQVIK